jgi:hypothetical protein
MGELLPGGLDVIFIHRRLFRWSGSRRSASAAIITDPVVYRRIVVYYDRIVDIGIMYDGGIYVDDGRIIPEDASVPFASDKTYSPISTTVVYAAIESNVRAPVSAMPSIDAACVAPIAGCPKETGTGRR